MSVINCIECGRANSPDTRTCIWCGLPLVRPGAAIEFDPIHAEVSYLEGFDRLDGPAPVELVVTPTAVEVHEMMPGTRSIVLPVVSIIAANVTGPLKRVGSPTIKESSGWLRIKGSDQPNDLQRSALTLKYQTDGEVMSVVFERTDANGLEHLRRIARTIKLLVKVKSIDAP